MYYLKHKRALTYIFCILFLASIALSGAYIVIESNHNCEGSGCTVCAHMQAAEKAIEQLGTALFFCAAHSAFNRSLLHHSVIGNRQYDIPNACHAKRQNE